MRSIRGLLPQLSGRDEAGPSVLTQPMGGDLRAGTKRLNLDELVFRSRDKYGTGKVSAGWTAQIGDLAHGEASA